MKSLEVRAVSEAANEEKDVGVGMRSQLQESRIGAIRDDGEPCGIGAMLHEEVTVGLAGEDDLVAPRQR